MAISSFDTWVNRTQETTSTTGLDDLIVLTGATSGHKAWPTTDGLWYFYLLLNPDGSWQVYRGQYYAAGPGLDRLAGPLDSWDDSTSNFVIQAGAIVDMVSPSSWFADANQALAFVAEIGLIGNLSTTFGAASVGMQGKLFPKIIQTTDGAAHELLVIAPSPGIICYDSMITAYQSGGGAGTVGDSAVWTISGAAKRVATGATTGYSSATKVFNDSGAAAWDVSVADGDPNRTITVTGEASKDIVWTWHGPIAATRVF